MSRAALCLSDQCVLVGLPKPVPEYRFYSKRRWRLDWAWPGEQLALEVEGGIWTRGRHTRGAGAIGDMAKYNTLACLGWRLIRVTPRDVRSGAALTWIEKALRARAIEAGRHV